MRGPARAAGHLGTGGDAAGDAARPRGAARSGDRSAGEPGRRAAASEAAAELPARSALVLLGARRAVAVDGAAAGDRPRDRGARAAAGGGVGGTARRGPQPGRGTRAPPAPGWPRVGPPAGRSPPRRALTQPPR